MWLFWKNVHFQTTFRSKWKPPHLCIAIFAESLYLYPEATGTVNATSCFFFWQRIVTLEFPWKDMTTQKTPWVDSHYHQYLLSKYGRVYGKSVFSLSRIRVPESPITVLLEWKKGIRVSKMWSVQSVVLLRCDWM